MLCRTAGSAWQRLRNLHRYKNEENYFPALINFQSGNLISSEKSCMRRSGLVDRRARCSLFASHMEHACVHGARNVPCGGPHRGTACLLSGPLEGMYVRLLKVIPETSRPANKRKREGCMPGLEEAPSLAGAPSAALPWVCGTLPRTLPLRSPKGASRQSSSRSQQSSRMGALPRHRAGCGKRSKAPGW